MNELTCPQCGEETEGLYEGYCRECCSDNQNELDSANLQYAEWESLINSQRDKRIKDAFK